MDKDDFEENQAKVLLALDILKKRWSLKYNWQVIRKLIETADKTVLQLAERKFRINHNKNNDK